MNNGFATKSFSLGGGTSAGIYEFKVNASGGNEKEVDSVVLDNQNPNIERTGDEYVGSSGNVEFSFKDELTDIVEISVEDSSGGDLISKSDSGYSCSKGNTCKESYSVETGTLSNGDTFTLEVTAKDNVGNEKTEEFEYTFDDQYQGDKDPSFYIEGADNNGNVKMEDDTSDQTLTVTLEETKSEETDLKVKCKDGNDDKLDSTDFREIKDSTKFICGLDGNKVAGKTKDIYIEVCDRAGNCIQTDKRTYNFDASDPEVIDFRTKKSYSVFNENFKVEYEVSDDSSGIDKLEYYFESGTNFGAGNSVSYSSSNKTFEVDTSGLSRGKKTVYLRAKDNVGRWSKAKQIDFEFYPNERPRVSINADSNFTMKAGSRKTFEVIVENTGKLFIEKVNLTGHSKGLLSTEKSIKNLGSGSSATVSLEINSEEADVGVHELTLKTDSPSAQKKVNVLVKANKEQQNKVDSLLSNYSKKLESIQKNISELRNNGLNKDLNETLNKNTKDFIEAVREAQSYVNNSKYYKALSALNNIDSKYKKASETYEKVEKQHSINKRNQMILMMVGGLIVILIAVGAFLLSSEEYDFDLEQYGVPELGVIDQLSEVSDEIKEKLQKEEEEVEEAFQGFK